MVRFANSTLVAALRFVQDINGAHSFSELRAIIPAKFQTLLSCDRISLDDLDLSTERRRVVPSPVPVWWPKLGELHAKHAHEHPLWHMRQRTRCHRVVSFADFADVASWKASTLYNEYYVSLGVRCQLGVQVRRIGTEISSLAFSRVRRDFTPQDRALVELLSPHIGNALRNARVWADAQVVPAERLHGSGPCCQIIALTSDGKRIRLHTAGALQLLREFYDHDTGVGAGLPEKVQRWLRIRREWLRRGEVVASALSPLVVSRGPRQLTIRLACLRPDETTLLLECTGIAGSHAAFGPAPASLTPREHEILQWAGEGKRNNEIAIILSISFRTVEKHFENIFARLGVETRTAAIRHVSEFPNGRHA